MTTTTTGVEATRRSWTIPADAEAATRKAVDKANRTITRNGLAAYAVEVEPAPPVPEFDMSNGCDGYRQIDGFNWPILRGEPVRVLCWHEKITFTVIGEVPCLADWQFVAVLQRDPHAGTMTRVVPGLEVNLDALRGRDASECDHCNVDRLRNKVYAVRHAVTGELKQVGSTCLRAFLGIEVSLPDAAFGIDDIDAHMDSLGEGGFGGGESIAFTSLDVMAVTVRMVDEYGWVKRVRYEDEPGFGRIPTASRVADVLYPANTWHAREASREVWASLTPEDHRRAADVLAYARTIEQDSEYAKNLAQVAAGDRVSRSNVGILASAVPGYNRHVERIIMERRRATSAHVGEVKERWIFHGLTVTRVDVVEGDYGTTYKTKMVDADGNLFAWAASSFYADKGDVVNVTAAIKAHEIYVGRGELAPGTADGNGDGERTRLRGLRVEKVKPYLGGRENAWYVTMFDADGREVTWKATVNPPRCKAGDRVDLLADMVIYETRLTNGRVAESMPGPALPHRLAKAPKAPKAPAKRKPCAAPATADSEPVSAPAAPAAPPVAAREGWAWGMTDSGEWLTILGSAWDTPPLAPTADQAQRPPALDAEWRRDRATLARVREMWHPGVSGSGLAYLIIERAPAPAPAPVDDDADIWAEFAALV